MKIFIGRVIDPVGMQLGNVVEFCRFEYVVIYPEKVNYAVGEGWVMGCVAILLGIGEVEVYSDDWWNKLQEVDICSDF